MHFQNAPYEETKLVSCTQGSIYDVIVDLRPSSPTFGKWHAVELSAKNNLALYVPKGFAHGFQTLEDQSKVYYQISHPYVPGASDGIRWNDPFVAIKWLYNEGLIISEKDQKYGDMADRFSNAPTSLVEG